MPPIQPSPRFEKVKDLGSGNFGLARLERDVATNAMVAIKYLPRGHTVDENVARELVCHRMLRHNNIVLFKELVLTPSHLAIVMEYASGGELFDRICSKGRFSEDEARYFFRQLIAGVAYIHSQSVAHRDLKLENALLDGSDPPVLKICDFGYSKSSLLHSAAKSTVGTPAYIAPEVLSRKPYDGTAADVWSCGVTLFVMLVGSYPFEDPAAPKDFRATIARIMAIKYSYPTGLKLTPEVKDLLAKVFVVDPLKRLTVPGIVEHPWFGGGKLADLVASIPAPEGMQSTQDVIQLVGEARHIGGAGGAGGVAGGPHEGGGGHHGGGDMGGDEAHISDEFAPEYLDADDGFD